MAIMIYELSQRMGTQVNESNKNSYVTGWFLGKHARASIVTAINFVLPEFMSDSTQLLPIDLWDFEETKEDHFLV